MPNNDSRVTRIYTRTDDKIKEMIDGGLVPEYLLKENEKGEKQSRGDAMVFDYLIDQLMGFYFLTDRVDENPLIEKQSIPES